MISRKQCWLAMLLVPLMVLAAARAADVAGGSEETIVRQGLLSAEDVAAELERALTEFDEAQQVQLSAPGRARRLSLQAAQRLEAIVATGIENGRLEYNLGNCYLQAGDIGRAILHYRRAERLIPGDPLLRENLRVARSRRLTNIEASRRSAVLQSVFFWHYGTSLRSRATWALLAYVAFWALLCTHNWVRRRGVLIAAGVCGLVALAGGTSAAVTQWAERNAPGGVVLAMDVSVYKGPGKGYQRQFEQPLQPGTEFTLRQRRRSWWNIELPDGQRGWIRADQGALVPPHVGAA